jgi:hypothetical protein
LITLAASGGLNGRSPPTGIRASVSARATSQVGAALRKLVRERRAKCETSRKVSSAGAEALEADVFQLHVGPTRLHHVDANPLGVVVAVWGFHEAARVGGKESRE